MLGFFNPSVILTYLSLISAALGLAYSFQGEKYWLIISLFCLMFSGVCDMFDGSIAAKVKRNEAEKLYGIEIDSLCDLVAFGALPAVIGFRLADGNLLSRIAGALLLLASVIRLAYFNVQELGRDRTEKRTFYTGLPVTMVALLYPLALALGTLLQIPFSWLSMTWFAPVCLILFAALEVSKLPLKKPYGIGRWLLLISGMAVFAGVIAVVLLKK